ncbi:MAG: hypothetical protein Q9219_007706 [cf. Caloplaca sp. 3 TL-2023]
MSTPSSPTRLFAVTICAKRKPGMDDEKTNTYLPILRNEYHNYISRTHAAHLKDLLVKNKIVDYTMQHNTTPLTTHTLPSLFPNLPTINHAPYDAFVQIVFRDIQDYINVKNDPHYRDVVNPDHGNFADAAGTRMAVGWFERHVCGGEKVERAGRGN